MSGEFLHAKEVTVALSSSDEDMKPKGPPIEQLVTNNSEPVAAPSPIQIDEELKMVEAVVDKRFDSKRMKWVCRQEDFPLLKYMKSQKQCKDSIKAGRVFVNGVVALDSCRILRENDVVTLLKAGLATSHDDDQTNTLQRLVPPESSDNLHLGVKILRDIPISSESASIDLRVVVAFKPVGVRVVGSFSTQTLEMITKSILDTSSRKLKCTPISGTNGVKCTPISKLDTGCAGLCVLIVTDDSYSKPIIQVPHVIYQFTALIHGSAPDGWEKGVYVQVPDGGSRKWKRQKISDSKTADVTEYSDHKADDNADIVTTTSQLDLGNSLFIRCIDRLDYSGDRSSTNLSTVEIRSSHDEGRLANVISYIMRKVGHPIVNDRFCKRELAALPRVMRNILKNKICFGSFSLDIKLNSVDTDAPPLDEVVSTEPHVRTQCSYWKGILCQNDDSSSVTTS